MNVTKRIKHIEKFRDTFDLSDLLTINLTSYLNLWLLNIFGDLHAKRLISFPRNCSKTLWHFRFYRNLQNQKSQISLPAKKFYSVKNIKEIMYEKIIRTYTMAASISENIFSGKNSIVIILSCNLTIYHFQLP